MPPTVPQHIQSTGNAAVPNLYRYATKELAQDATIAYILDWANPAYRSAHPRLNRLGTALLRALLRTMIEEHAIPEVRSIRIKTQIHRIDVLARINDDRENGLLLLIEDKVDTHERPNQIQGYIEAARKRYPGRTLVPVYVKTGNASKSSLPDETECGRFLRQDILDVLNRFPDTGDTIVDNFRVHLQEWQGKFLRYRTRPATQWKGDEYQGYYSELESRMNKDERWNLSGWGSTPNPAGGFLHYAFYSKTLQWEGHTVIVYLQIENALRLTLRVGNWKGFRIDSRFMYAVLRRARELNGDYGSLQIRKAGRFRGGKSAAVAEITFGGTEGYLALDEGGILDLDRTMKRLKLAGTLVTALCDQWQTA